MKNYLLGLAALSLLAGASSCKDETSDSPGGGRRLTFETVLGKHTDPKASEFTNASWQNGDQLTVYAFPEGSDEEAYAGPITITYDNGGDADPATGTWSLSRPLTSLGTRVYYYTWFPDDASVTNKVHGTVDDSYSFTYTVPADYTLQRDLIATPNVVTSGYDITLAFSHILSEINFGIVRTLGMKIEIDPASIRLTGLNNAGNYRMGALPSGVTERWSGQSGTAGYDYTPITGTNVTDGSSSGIQYMGNQGGSSGNTNVNALMLLPQSFEAGSQAAITFDYFLTINDEGGTPVRYPTTGYNTAEVLLRDFDTYIWEPDKRYLYLFDFSSYVVTGDITFTVDVTTWTDDDTNTVAETVQVASPTLANIEEAIENQSEANAGDSGLKIFPISVPVVVPANLTPINVIYGFDAFDQIRIEFESEASADKFSSVIDPANWTMARDAYNTRVVVLTCINPVAAP